MNDFLTSMQSLTLYQHINKTTKKDEKNTSELENDDLKLEMIKVKKIITQSPSTIKIDSVTFQDFSSSIHKIDSPSISAATGNKDIYAQENSFSSASSKASSQAIHITSNTNIKSGSSSLGLGNYHSNFLSSSSSSLPIVKQFGIVKMTGTEGKLKNGYTIGKGAKERASAHIGYITRDENGKSISEIKDKNGNTITKEEALNEIDKIKAERRIVLSPNHRLNLTNEQIDKVVRATMNSYSESFGKEFNYFYAIHNNTSTSHAHILMTSTNPDGDGIKMYKDEVFELKMIFDDNLKELIKENGIKIKDDSMIPTAKQIANFLGAIPDTTIFNQNKLLAYKISQKYDLEFDSKEIDKSPTKLEDWFNKNEKQYTDYFITSKNKDAFLFQEYIKISKDLSVKYDLRLDDKTLNNVKDFKNWLADKEEVFLAEKIAQDKNIILNKEDVADKNKLYKWFRENENDVKSWNEEKKYFPSKQLSSLSKKYGNMVDNRPDNILTSRKEARDFVRNYTKNPLDYAGDSRKSLYDILVTKKEQYKNELSQDRITKLSYQTEINRLNTLQHRLAQSQEISESSLKRYNIDTKLYSIDSKTIKIDGINFTNEDTREKLKSKIDAHIQNLNKDDTKTDEYSRTYINKSIALNHVISKSQNVSISALENIGLNKEKDLKDFNIEKVATELKIINFKNTDLYNDRQSIKDAEAINKDRPLAHQVTNIQKIVKQFGLEQSNNSTNMTYKEANKYIDTHKNFNSYNVEKITNMIQNVRTQNLSILTDDAYLNKYIDNINNNLEKLQTKIVQGKNISLYDVQLTGLDTKNLETYQATFKDKQVSMIRTSSLENIKINETISNAIFNSPKYFNNIANRLYTEHGIDIKTPQDLSDNFDKIGKQSDLRSLITKTVQHHLSAFEQNEENQKEIKNLNGFLAKNHGLYPIFESDIKKIGANTIDFIDKSTITIKVEVVPNNESNKEELLNVFGKIINESGNKINSVQINDIDRLAIDDLNETIKKKIDFRELANEYIKNDATNPKETIEYVSAILENRTLNGMSYMIEQNKIEDVPKNFLEARNIDTNSFVIEEKDKEVDTITMGSKANLEQFKEFLITNNLEHIITQETTVLSVNYQEDIKAFLSEYTELNSSNINDFNTLLFFAVEDKNIILMDKLYELDIDSKEDVYLLQLKFESYAEALDISKDEIFSKMLIKYFNLDENEISQLNDLEKTFDTYLEFSNDKNTDDIKHKLYIETMTELVNQKYEQYVWEYFDMGNENVSELNMNAYFESTQNIIEDANILNELVSQQIDTNEFHSTLEELIKNGDFKQVEEMLNDERVENTTRITFEYMLNTMFNDENIMDEVYETVIDKIKLEEKIYETFKEDDYLIDEIKKIDLDLEGEQMQEFLEEMQLEEMEEHERILGE